MIKKKNWNIEKINANHRQEIDEIVISHLGNIALYYLYLITWK